MPRPRQRYCSKKCYKTTWARKSRGYAPPQQSRCRICKTSFLPPTFHPRARTCSSVCSSKLEYRNHRTTYLARVQKWLTENRSAANAYSRMYRLRDPEKSAARSKVGYALKTGALNRPTQCQKCNLPCKPHAHHHRGYDRPLDVAWLCSRCHAEAHHPLTNAESQTALGPP